MTQTKKGNQWYFGMKAHTGTDTKNRTVHTVVATTASVHDSVVMEDLLHGGEESVYGDKAYADETRKRDFEERGIKWCVSRKAGRGHRKARYRGITKNASQLFTLFSLANLYLVRKQLLHQPA